MTFSSLSLCFNLVVVAGWVGGGGGGGCGAGNSGGLVLDSFVLVGAAVSVDSVGTARS